MSDLIVIDKYPVKEALKRLLEDKTTGKNIIFATDMYSDYGYTELNTMTIHAIMGFSSCDIQPRVRKAQAEQNLRTRKKAEVFTPTWICNMMNNHCDSEWFGRKDVFNHTDNENHWYSTCERIIFPEGKTWQQYVDSRRLEITCGEAPYLVSRYDTTTGEIIPIKERIGLLDRKLRIVNENTTDEEEWLKWTERAFESVYGYEFQGDNLLIARINMLVTFSDYLRERWHREATATEIKKIANIIAWNLWQMDGLADSVPLGIPEDSYSQISLLDENDEKESSSVDCKIKDWRDNRPKIFRKLMDKNERGVNMKFDYVIGNPPYQEDRRGESTTALPVYHNFMNAAYSIATSVELITPARFLFNAGRTPKEWNTRMLNDPHFNVLMYERNASKIFPNTEIKGGVVITYRDTTKKSTPIGTFSIHPEINKILSKISSIETKKMKLDSIAFVASKFNTSLLFEQFPQYAGHERRMSSNVLSFDCFHNSPVNNDDVYIYGIISGKRGGKYISKDLVDTSDIHIDKYKIVMPKADGSGNFGDTLTMPELLKPNSGFTHTFLGMGAFDSKIEAAAALNYIKTKFARALLSVLKVTQDMNADKWRLVPLQDFTPDSDIDWSVSIPEIDKQLYEKYGLTQEEIDFIESHVKEMN